MTMYVKVTAGVAAAYTLTDLRAGSPSVSFPAEPTAALLQTYHVYPCTVPPYPAHNVTWERVVSDGFEEIGGAWQAKWRVEAVPSAEARDRATMPRDLFAIGAAARDWISEAEAEDWAAGTAIPAFVAGIIAQAIPEADRLAVRIAVRTQAEIGRMDRLVPMLMAAKSVSDAEMDAFYGREG